MLLHGVVTSRFHYYHGVSVSSSHPQFSTACAPAARRIHSRPQRPIPARPSSAAEVVTPARRCRRRPRGRVGRRLREGGGPRQAVGAGREKRRAARSAGVRACGPRGEHGSAPGGGLPASFRSCLACRRRPLWIPAWKRNPGCRRLPEHAPGRPLPPPSLAGPESPPSVRPSLGARVLEKASVRTRGCKRRRRRSPDSAATSEESSSARSALRPAQLRSQSHPLVFDEIIL
ncbi:hypothetical protein PVAP13_4KG361220 [Panicum virgatum]|uniref:Uncharacterized protein n=1 Tax=Panicum virgatum TaxID=38727 RepID=A0A8T0TP34_PANVG|nr:hypothetical protein PVAP13_4KG361220 [Panicum virgatum]